MVEMSKAIRGVIEDHSRDLTLSGLADEDLDEIWQIVTAFSMDLREEVERRGLL